jgi:hypothetical protein
MYNSNEEIKVGTSSKWIANNLSPDDNVVVFIDIGVKTQQKDPWQPRLESLPRIAFYTCPTCIGLKISKLYFKCNFWDWILMLRPNITHIIIKLFLA